jgi:hypothetical protein
MTKPSRTANLESGTRNSESHWLAPTMALAYGRESTLSLFEFGLTDHLEGPRERPSAEYPTERIRSEAGFGKDRMTLDLRNVRVLRQ